MPLRDGGAGRYGRGSGPDAWASCLVRRWGGRQGGHNRPCVPLQAPVRSCGPSTS